jgi:CO dehydrogenase maturation factor
VRVAVAGKGGAGKTTLSATLARLAAQRGHRVVCLDADSNPNLAVALGIAGDQPPGSLPVSAVSRRLDGPALSEPVHDLLAQHGTPGPDGIVLASMGMPAHAEEGCLCSAHGVVRAALADLADPDTVTVVDLEASPEHFSRGTARHVDVLLLVAEPYYRSLETVRRMAALASELPIPTVGVIGNKVRDEQDRDAMEAFCDRHNLALLGLVPWDDTVLDADRARTPLAEVAPDGPVVAAVAALLDRATGVATHA